MRSPVGSLWSEPRAPGSRPVGPRDLALLGFSLVAVAEAALRPGLDDRVAQGVVGGLAVSALVWRRARPLLAVAVAVVVPSVLALVTGTSVELYSVAVLLAVPYGLARWGSGRDVVVGGALFAVQQVVVLATGEPVGDVVGGLVILAAAVSLGAAVRFRARARLRTADEVRLRERERIARDLHDTVAHHVSAIAVRAQVGQALAASEPQRAAAELALIEAEARRTLAEMRGLVRVLRRDGPGAGEPAESLGAAELERLADPAPGVPPVRLDADPLDRVAAPVVAAVVRIAQEAVTNARRHARGARAVDVVVRVDDDAVRLRVHDDGGPVPPSRRGDGWGVAGMGERAALLGGRCDAGPDPAGGWSVTATLPLRWDA
ncbi:histidine kinase [Actinotalea sp. AC32]|nr:histidine kinase [Actinotalea sp. AC32]